MKPPQCSATYIHFQHFNGIKYNFPQICKHCTKDKTSLRYGLRARRCVKTRAQIMMMMVVVGRENDRAEVDKRQMVWMGITKTTTSNSNHVCIVRR